MKKKCLPFLVLMLALAGCRSASNGVVVESDIAYESDAGYVCADSECTVINYSMPSGNDLVLETERHIIEIAAPTDAKYTYYVWAGGKTTSDDPDLIVSDGQSMVLVEE